jgi:DNA-binding CsgD family transcriptional regulator
MNISNVDLFRQLGNLLYRDSELFVKDSDGRYIFVNDYFDTSMQAHGFIAEGESIIGKSDFDLYGHCPGYTRIKANDLTLLEDGIPVNARETVTTLVSGCDLKYHTKKWLFLSADDNRYILGLCRLYSEIHLCSGKISLSERQMETLSGVFFGLSAKEIAKKIGVSYRTIETYIEQLKIKLTSKSKNELNRVILDNNLQDVMRYYFEIIK